MVLIGEIEGTVDMDAFTFRAYKDVRRFDFVAVKSEKEEKWILAQISNVKKHPDGRTEAEAAVIGYREKGLLKKPRYVVKPGSMVYLADEEVIGETLGLKTDGLYVGRLDSNKDISIHLNPEDFFKHMAVLAKSGAGKSYVTGVLIEELLEQNYPVLIIDPHGEYSTLGVENDELEEAAEKRYDVAKKGYPINHYTTNTELNPNAEKISFRSTNMGTQEIQDMLPTSITSSQLGVLYTATRDLKDRDYTLDTLIDTVMNVDTKAKWGLVNALEILKDAGIFDENATPLEDLIQEGEATIIDLKASNPDIQEMVVYKLAKELFHKRKMGKVPPFIMVIEEAHNFVPERSFGKATSSEIMRTIASEGRKFGLGIVVVSQRPARVDKNVLSQCHNQIIMRLTNPNDLSAIAGSFEGVTSDVKTYLAGLPPGTGLILGKEYPVMVDVRTRRSKHGGGMGQVTEAVGVAEEPAVEMIRIFNPAMSKSMAEKQLRRKLKRAYYPFYLVENTSGKVLVDAVDGSVKDAQTSLADEALEVLNFIKVKDRTPQEVADKLDVSDQELADILEQLRDSNTITAAENEAGGTVFRARSSIFDKDVSKTDKQGKRIHEKISEEDARETALQHLEEIDRIEKVYYPYYVEGDFVFDAVTGEPV